MQADGFIAFLGLVLAAWAITPSERLNDLRVRMTWFDVVILVVAIGVLHYILFLPVLESLGIALPLGPWRWGFTPELASYAILICSSLVVAFRLSFSGLRRRKIIAFRRQSEELLFRRRYAELVFLVDRHLDTLVRAHQNRFILPRIRAWIEPPVWVDLVVEGDVENTKRTWSSLDGLRGKLARWLPSYAVSQEAATHTLRRILLDESFVRESALIAPELGLRVLAKDVPDRYSFLEKWIAALLRDRSSAIYYEVEQNQNTAAGRRYYFPETNRIIYSLFRDSQRAYELGVYKPIGDFVIRRFDAKFRKGKVDRYNQSIDAFCETERWRDPVYVVLRLFDFMVSEAVYQGVRSHMWLYYIPHFVEAIARNTRPANSVDLGREWPTPYHYFLYECFSLLGDWIGIAEEIEDGNPHAAPEAVNTEHENGNIPKSACIALGQAWFTVARSAQISDRFKIYLLEAVIFRINRLRGNQRLDQYRAVAVRSLMTGAWRTGQALEEHQGRTWALLRSVDHVLRGDIESELEEHNVI